MDNYGKPQSDQAWELAKWRNEDWHPNEYYTASWDSDSEPIVIGGCPRSGSTLLRLFLGEHRDVIDGPETHLFLPLPINIMRLESRFQMPSGSLEGLRNTALTQAAFIDGFQKLLLAQSGRCRWVEKTSRNVHAFTWIRDRFPKATLLHIIRDPRDVVVSLRTHPRFKRGQGDRVLSNWQHPWHECIDRWKRCIEDGIRLRGYTQYMEVKYEALVTDTESAIRRICDRSGLQFDPSMLSTKSRQDKVTGMQRPFVINNLEAGGPISQESIGRWHRELPSEVLSILEAKLDNLMILTGYPLEDE